MSPSPGSDSFYTSDFLQLIKLSMETASGERTNNVDNEHDESTSRRSKIVNQGLFLFSNVYSAEMGEGGRGRVVKSDATTVIVKLYLPDDNIGRDQSTRRYSLLFFFLLASLLHYKAIM